MCKQKNLLALLLVGLAGVSFVGCGGKNEEAQPAPTASVPTAAATAPEPPPSTTPMTAAPGSDPATVDHANKMRDEVRSNDR